MPAAIAAAQDICITARAATRFSGLSSWRGIRVEKVAAFIEGSTIYSLGTYDFREFSFRQTGTGAVDSASGGEVDRQDGEKHGELERGGPYDEPCDAALAR